MSLRLLTVLLYILFSGFAEAAPERDDDCGDFTFEDIEAVDSIPDCGEVEDDADKDNGTSWLSILPPLVAIGIALVFRQVLLALFIGVWMGAWLHAGATAGAVFTTFFTTVSEYIVPSIADPDHVSILVFTLLIGGMVGIILYLCSKVSLIPIGFR